MDQASFKFVNYKVVNFSFNSDNIKGEDISIKLDPSGVYSNNDKVFTLKFKFYAFNKEASHNEHFVYCDMQADFVFSDGVVNLDSIPKYFYPNSIAIVFPYLRSFISSLTIQANLKPIILPTMNLTSLSNPLQQNTIQR